MPRLSFTAQLHRHLDSPSAQLDGATVGEVLEGYFRSHPQLRGYVLDDQGAVRRHVAIFLNRNLIRDRTRLSDPVRADDEIYVSQALSGG